MQSNRETVLGAIDGMRTKADRIRALALAGYLRSEIAAMLGIRYQHVRGVLERSGIDLGRTRDVVIEREPVEIEVPAEEVQPLGEDYLLRSGASSASQNGGSPATMPSSFHRRRRGKQASMRSSWTARSYTSG
jgi:hypothetical protein